MPSPSPSRVALATGLGLGVAVAVLTLATTASAEELATPVAPSTVVAGSPFSLTGTGCPTVDAAHPAFAVVLTDAAETSDDLATGESDATGAWSVTLAFPADTPPGEHEIGAICGGGHGGGTESGYPLVVVTVTAPATPATAASSSAEASGD